jgi:hypothetical protein
MLCAAAAGALAARMPKSEPIVKTPIDMPQAWPAGPADGRSVAVENWWR